jgi:anti-sigma factor RsiW
MTDCPNVEIREWLPDYLSGRLEAAARSLVELHLAHCAECRAELDTIRLVREAYAAALTVPVDVNAVVAALPRARLARRNPSRSWVRSHAMQIAAAVSFVALGGMSLAVSRSFFGDAGVGPDSIAAVAGGAGSTNETSLPAISFGGGLTDLADEDLESLLAALESIEALPSAEPTTVVIGAGERQGT